MDIVHELIRTSDELLPFFDLNENDLVKTYASGKWSVKQLLHHITDADTVLYDRVRRGISKPGQVVWGFDQDAWSENLNYIDLPLETSKFDFLFFVFHSFYFVAIQNLASDTS